MLEDLRLSSKVGIPRSCVSESRLVLDQVLSRRVLLVNIRDDCCAIRVQDVFIEFGSQRGLV